MSNWQLFFVAAAIWSLGAAMPGLVSPRRGFRLLYGIESDRFYELFQLRAISLVILLFGLGYAIIAVEPSANLGLILIGLLGNLLFAVVVTLLFFMRRATRFALLIAAFDLAFAAGFLFYLSITVAFIPELVG
jgi:hypothetical protein